MKQFNFSNIIAIVAVLLCFYSFSGGNNKPVVEGETDYCIFRVNPIYNFVEEAYSDGRHEKKSMKEYLKENDDNYLLLYTAKRLKELSNQGWELKFESAGSQGSSSSTHPFDQYIFQRSK